MKTITMYELLGMVKDGKAPKKVKYKDKIYYYHSGYDFNYMYNSSNYSPMDKNNSLFTFNSYKIKDGKQCWNDNATIDFLRNEVEILEEEKKIPEKLNIEDDGNTITLFGEKENEWTILDNVNVIICNKINSIIDYLKIKGE